MFSLSNGTPVHLNRDYYHKLDIILEWCNTHYGTLPSSNWAYEVVFGHATFYFKKEKDANWFVLKWL